MTTITTDPIRRVTAREMYVATFEASIDLVVVNANTKAGAIIAVTPEFGGIAVITPSMQTRVDVDDVAHAYPNGTSLTSAQKTMDEFCKIDSGTDVDTWTTDDSTGQKSFVLEVVNYDSSSHHYYVHLKLYANFFTGTVT